MALQTFSGSFALNTSTGNKSITGVGFLPKAVIFFGSRLTAAGTSNLYYERNAIGVGISSSSRAAISAAFGGNDASAATEDDNTKCLIMDNGLGTGGLIYAADLVSLDSDGFTINITTAPLVAELVGFIAIGGSDLTNVFLKQFQAPASTGNQATTGVGFKPDAMLLFSADMTAAPPTTLTATERYAIGFVVSATQRVALCHRYGTTEELTNKALTQIAGDLSTHDLQADLTSFDSDGFTLNFSSTNNGAYIWALCLKGGQYYAGNDTQKTSTGTKANTGPGFTPTGILFASQNAAASSSILTQPTAITHGAMSASTQRFWVWSGVSSTTSWGIGIDLSNALAMLSISGGTITKNAEADFSSFDATGFTLNWGTADGTAREFIFLAMGSSGINASLLSGTISQPTYQRQPVQPQIPFLQNQTLTQLIITSTIGQPIGSIAYLLPGVRGVFYSVAAPSDIIMLTRMLLGFGL